MCSEAYGSAENTRHSLRLNVGGMGGGGGKVCTGLESYLLMPVTRRRVGKDKPGSSREGQATLYKTGRTSSQRDEKL